MCAPPDICLFCVSCYPKECRPPLTYVPVFGGERNPFSPQFPKLSMLISPAIPMHLKLPGHGPFSHVWEHELLPRVLGEAAAKQW